MARRPTLGGFIVGAAAFLRDAVWYGCMFAALAKVAILVVALCVSTAHAQPVPVTWRPPVNCGTGTALTWTGTTWGCAVNTNVTGSGTANAIAKFTSVTVVGNSLLTDDATTLSYNAGKFTVASSSGNTAVAGTLGATGATTLSSTLSVADSSTLGDNTSNDVTTVNGRVLVTAADPANHALNVLSGVTGLTTNNRVGIRSSSGGTVDTTSSAIDFFAMQALNSSTRSAGANTLRAVGITASATGSGTQTNIGGLFAASGGSTLIALETTTGSNYFNTVSGSAGIGYAEGTALPSLLSVNGAATIVGNASLNTTSGATTIGFSTATASALTVNGTSVFNSTRVGSEGAIAANYTGTSQAGDRYAIVATNSGTYDSTAATRNAYAIRAICTASQAAGANGVGCVGLYATATSGTSNAAIQTVDGNALLNTSSGSTVIGNGSTLGINASTSLFPSTVPKLEILTGTATSTSYNEGIVLRHNGHDGTASITRRLGFLMKLSSEGSATESNKMGGMVLDSTSTFANSPTLSLVVADTKRVLIGPGGDVTINTPTNAVNALTISGLNGAQNAFRINDAATSQTASVEAGRVFLTGSVDTTSAAITRTGLRIDQTMTKAAGSNTFSQVGARIEVTSASDSNIGLQINASGATSNTALTTGTGNVILNATSGTTAINGNTTIGSSTSGSTHNINGITNFISTSTSNSFNFTWTPVASTVVSSTAMKFLGNGTFDTTAATAANYGIFVQTTATRSAGSNSLTNVAGRFDATGGQANVALQTDNGNVTLNGTSGTTTAGFSTATSNALTVNGSGVLTSNPAAATTSTQAFTSNRGGTVDTTAGALDSTAFSAFATTTRSAGSNTHRNYAISASASGAATNNVAIRTNDGDNWFNVVSGVVTIGYAAAAGPGAKFSVTSSTNTVAVALTPAGATNSRTAIDQSLTGTLDTTSGALLAIGGNFSSTATRSAGANTLTNIGLKVAASGAQSNIGLQVEAGDTLVKSTAVTFGTASTTVHVTDIDTSVRPTLTNCGTGATIKGNDSSAKLTTGTTSGACTVTFGTAYSANASCTVSARDGVDRVYSVSTTALAFTSVTDSQVYDIECREH